MSPPPDVFGRSPPSVLGSPRTSSGGYLPSLEINPECSLERQILKLRLQYFGHLMRRLPGKNPDVGKV